MHGHLTVYQVVNGLWTINVTVPVLIWYVFDISGRFGCPLLPCHPFRITLHYRLRLSGIRCGTDRSGQLAIRLQSCARMSHYVLSIMLMEFLPGVFYLRHSEVTGYAKFRSLKVAVAHPDGVTHKLSLLVMAEHDGITLVLHLVAVALPRELVKLTERSFASIVYLVSVSVAYILWQFPSAALVDDVRCGMPDSLSTWSDATYWLCARLVCASFGLPW